MSVHRRGFLFAAGVATAAAHARHAAAQKRFKACVIGDTEAGGYGHSLHMVWAGRDDVEVVGLADPHEAGRAAHASECGALRSYADYREMLDKEKPDLVAVGPRCTTRHKEYLLACCEAGAHGILEKPLTPDLEEADTVIDAIEKRKLKWTIAFNLRVHPAYRHVRRMVLEEGIVGEILEVRGRGKEDHRAGAEDLIVLGVHAFDLMVDLLGMPAWCFADIQVKGRPATKGDVREATEPLGPIVGDRIDAMYGFPNAVYGHFASASNRDGNGGRWGLDICGSLGVVAMRMDAITEVQLLANPPWTQVTKPAQWQLLPGVREAISEDTSGGRYNALVDDLIAAIEQDREPDVSLRDARSAHEMIQGVFASYVAGTRVALPLEQRGHPLASWA